MHVIIGAKKATQRINRGVVKRRTFCNDLIIALGVFIAVRSVSARPQIDRLQNHNRPLGILGHLDHY